MKKESMLFSFGLRPEEFIREAKMFGYSISKRDESCSLIQFSDYNGDIKINVYYRTNTVQTTIKHPKSRTRRQLTRKGITLEELIKIFRYPRLHTGKGYFIKGITKDSEGRIWKKV